MCAAGMSTSMLVQRMQAAASNQGYECSINAVSVSDAAKAGEGADIVLLGPQVRFQKNKVEKLVSCPVEAIDMSAYGRMDGAAVLNHVKEVLGD